MKALSVTLAAVGAVALVLAGAAPAIAAGNTIDPGDSLYAIDCDETVYNDWQLMSVNSSTAVSTTIGTGSGSTSDTAFACAFQPAYNAVTGKSYYIQSEFTGDGNFYFLAEINVATGVSTRLGEFYYESGEFDVQPAVESMAIGTNGAAFVLAEGTLFSVNLTSGLLSAVSLPGGSLLGAYAFAVDPSTGIFYAVDETNNLFELDTTNGNYFFLSLVGAPAGDVVYSLQIDGGGTFWVEIDEDVDGPATAGLWSFTLATVNAPVYSGVFTDDPYYTEALLIIPGAALAATGTDVSGAPLIAGGAALIALLGVGAVVVARRRAA